MLLLNKYCAECLKTQVFLDVGDHFVCLCCGKRLWKALTEPVRTAA